MGAFVVESDVEQLTKSPNNVVVSRWAGRSVGPEHERNCHCMQASRFNLLWITYYCEDGFDMVSLCQLP